MATDKKNARYFDGDLGVLRGRENGDYWLDTGDTGGGNVHNCRSDMGVAPPGT